MNSPTYIDNGTQWWLTKLLEDYPEIEEYAVQALGDMNEFLPTGSRTPCSPVSATLSPMSARACTTS